MQLLIVSEGMIELPTLVYGTGLLHRSVPIGNPDKRCSSLYHKILYANAKIFEKY